MSTQTDQPTTGQPSDSGDCSVARTLGELDTGIANMQPEHFYNVKERYQRVLSGRVVASDCIVTWPDLGGQPSLVMARPDQVGTGVREFHFVLQRR